MGGELNEYFIIIYKYLICNYNCVYGYFLLIGAKINLLCLPIML